MVWFTFCDYESHKHKLHTLGARIPICQAGYDDRKLVYDALFRDVYLLVPADHHLRLEAVISGRNPLTNLPVFYLRLTPPEGQDDSQHQRVMVLRPPSNIGDTLVLDVPSEVVDASRIHNVDRALFEMAYANL